MEVHLEFKLNRIKVIPDYSIHNILRLQGFGSTSTAICKEPKSLELIHDGAFKLKNFALSNYKEEY